MFFPKEMSILSSAVKERSEKDKEAIATLVHNTVIQRLGALLLSLQHNSISNSDISNHVLNAVEDLRSICYKLYPAHLNILGLQESLQQLFLDWQNNTHIKIEEKIFGFNTVKMDATIKNNIYKIITELLENIRKHSQSTKVVLTLICSVPYINLTIEDNEIVGILGESGSGKSTLSSLLLHELKPTTGYIDVDTHDILPVFEHASDSFNPKLTIQQSLADLYSIREDREDMDISIQYFEDKYGPFKSFNEILSEYYQRLGVKNYGNSNK